MAIIILNKYWLRKEKSHFLDELLSLGLPWPLPDWNSANVLPSPTGVDTEFHTFGLKPKLACTCPPMTAKSLTNRNYFNCSFWVHLEKCFWTSLPSVFYGQGQILLRWAWKSWQYEHKSGDIKFHLSVQELICTVFPTFCSSQWESHTHSVLAA